MGNKEKYLKSAGNKEKYFKKVGNKEKCLIIAGGVLINPHIIMEKIKNTKFDLIFACDSGYNNAVKLNINVDILVGDFDSISGKISSDLEIIKLNTEKDETDLKIAVELALEKKYKEIHILCATGGRIDHLLCNLSILEYINDKGSNGFLIDEYNEISINNCQNISYQNTSKYVSIIPITNNITLTLTNLKYALNKKIVYRDNIISVSNETENETYQIDISDGKAYIIKSDDA